MTSVSRTDLSLKMVFNLCVCVCQASVSVPDGPPPPSGDGEAYGGLPSSGPLPPHMMVKSEPGRTRTHKYANTC